MSLGPKAIALCILALLAQGSAVAKPPSLTGFFPAGAERGKSLTVTASGSFDHWPPKIWTDREGLTIKADAEKKKFSVQVDPTAAPGVVRVRLYDEEGATELRPFFIGAIPEIAEIEPNNHPKRPQPIEPPSVTINGKLEKSEDVDGFSVVLKRGQTLVADLEANHHLGSPMDAVMQVVSTRGFVLEQNHDAKGLDPRIVFEGPADGSYIVRVFAFPSTPDSTIRFAGGDAYVYRLTLTKGPFVDHADPLAISRREKSFSITAHGWNISGTRIDSFPDDDGRDTFSLDDPRVAGTVNIRRVAGAVVEEHESNDLGHPQPISGQVVVSGHIGSAGDWDVFEVALRKDEATVFRVESRSLGFPLDATLAVLDTEGRTLAESDDTGNERDPELAFTAPSDGRYRVVIKDLHDLGGPRFAYLLFQGIPEPDFELSLPADRFDLIKGQPLKLTVAINRKNGFSDMIEVRAEDLPAGLVGASALSRQADASAKSVTLELRAEGDIQPGPFRVRGRRADRKSRARPALAEIPGDNAKTDRPWVTPRPAEAPKPK